LDCAGTISNPWFSRSRMVMKISDLIAYLQKYQAEFGDIDVELNLDGAKIGPDGKVPTKAPTPTDPARWAVPKYVPMFGGFGPAQTKDEEDSKVKRSSSKHPAFILQQFLKDSDKLNFSWRKAEEKLKDSLYVNKNKILIDKDISDIASKYFNYPLIKP
jgi:hypothetical protein